MVTIAQLPALPKDLFDLLKYGEFGAAVLMLVLGFYLYYRAANTPVAAEISTRQNVGRQFMVFALVFFSLCSLLDMVKFLLPPAHPQVSAMITVPPLDNQHVEEYGKVMIVISDGQVQSEKQALGDHPQIFSLHDNTQFTISLSGLIEKLRQPKTAKQVVENDLGTQTNDFGPRQPK
jgi:hypothetical protein